MCDTFCIARPGGMLFAKSSDRPVDEVQVLRWFDRRPGGGAEVRATYVDVPDRGAAALLGSQPTWMWGLEHGVNEHRVAIGNERVWTVDDPRAAPPALLGMDLVRLGLERARTADAAVDAMTDLLETHGQGGSGEAGQDEPYWSSFLVVDPGGGWVVETSGRTWVAQPVAAGTSISNRLTLRSAWTRSSGDIDPGADWDAWRAPAMPTGIADHRLAATGRCVALGRNARPADAAAALRDHGAGPWGSPDGDGGVVVPVPGGVGDDWSGVTVCMHVRGVSCTTASIVCDLPASPDEPVRGWASLGTPCTSAFLPVAILGGVGAVMPSFLGDEDAWRAMGRLSRAVERPGDEGLEALASARAALARVESAAWEEADELWSSGATAGAWQAAAERWDGRMRAAVREVEAAVGATR